MENQTILITIIRVRLFGKLCTDARAMYHKDAFYHFMFNSNHHFNFKKSIPQKLIRSRVWRKAIEEYYNK